MKLNPAVAAILNFINSYCPDTKTLQKYQLFDLEVKGQGQTDVKMARDTSSHDFTPTYQISLIYLKRQQSYDLDTKTFKKYQSFDLEVKGQGQNVFMMVHDTPSHDYAPTYQISLTYLKRQKRYGPDR